MSSFDFRPGKYQKEITQFVGTDWSIFENRDEKKLTTRLFRVFLSVHPFFVFLFFLKPTVILSCIFPFGGAIEEKKIQSRLINMTLSTYKIVTLFIVVIEYIKIIYIIVCKASHTENGSAVLRLFYRVRDELKQYIDFHSTSSFFSL